MEYLKVIMRMSFFYIFIILIYRIMGKREVGQLGIVDLIVSILIAELVAISVEDLSVSILHSVVPIICLVVLQIVLSYSSLKSSKLRRILDGVPSFIIKNGKVNYKEMIKQKYGLDDLLEQLRERGYRNVEEVEYAILENNGTLSVFPYGKMKRNSPLPLALIIDGSVQDDTLKAMGKDRGYVDRLIERSNLELEEIFYAFSKNDKMYVIRYEDLN